MKYQEESQLRKDPEKDAVVTEESHMLIQVRAEGIIGKKGEGDAVGGEGGVC